MPEPLTIGIDIGGTSVKAGVVTRGGEIVATEAVRTAGSPEAVADQIVSIARMLDRRDVRAVGLGIPARVDGRARTIQPGGFVDLSGVELTKRVRTTFGRPVAVENDGTMALIAETRIGAARGRSHVVMFTIGTGIGGAVMVGGEVLYGASSAGQLGHLTVDVEGLRCLCGRRGCLETVSSGTALARLISEADLPEGTRVEDLLERSGSDAPAWRVLDAWTRPLRAAIDSTVAAFAPEIVVLGGGLGGAAHRTLATQPAVSPWFQCPVVASGLGSQSGIIGAGLAAFANMERGE